ncbi:hypothetical protein AM500_19890 [Bacillus sp. FJAT-18017]|uniref:hypothetical protein n=1 Tax=Bacillus sp. FJAT-18017 TaxID=1705566 RepID=UPI0006AD9EBD|nr:hypothetical protein [Bacillus sp. FJAT-18017]ALC91793.1 hypothetical protein AM500_19890 [Bacillus sp. FJAT-18017]
MKSDLKKREIQNNYRKSLQQKRENKKHTLEAAFVIFAIVVIALYFLPDNLISTDTNFKGENKELKWFQGASAIDQELKRSSEHYRGIAIDTNPKPIKYLISTSLIDSEPGAEEAALELTDQAAGVIESLQLPLFLKEGETYEIIVLGKDNEELLRKEFQ